MASKTHTHSNRQSQHIDFVVPAIGLYAVKQSTNTNQLKNSYDRTLLNEDLCGTFIAPMHERPSQIYSNLPKNAKLSPTKTKHSINANFYNPTNSKQNRRYYDDGKSIVSESQELLSSQFRTSKNQSYRASDIKIDNTTNLEKQFREMSDKYDNLDQYDHRVNNAQYVNRKRRNNMSTQFNINSKLVLAQSEVSNRQGSMKNSQKQPFVFNKIVGHYKSSCRLK